MDDKQNGFDSLFSSILIIEVFIELLSFFDCFVLVNDLSNAGVVLWISKSCFIFGVLLLCDFESVTVSKEGDDLI